MLQKNAAMGFLFIVGIGVNSPIMLFGGIVATLSGLIAARLFQYDSNSIHDGAYGFNAALVGLAIPYFMPVNIVSFGWLIWGGLFSTIVMHFMLTRIPSVPPFTAPFVISTWLILVFSEAVGIDLSTAPSTSAVIGDLYSVLQGVGQVMFQENWLTGVIFLGGLFFYSRSAGSWAIIGSGLGVLIAHIFNCPEESILSGIYGFNASLIAIALSQHFDESIFPILLGAIISVLLVIAFEWIAFPSLTAPFVLGSWTILGFHSVSTRHC